ncbi:MAG TPA: hypothetical protein VFE47_15350 [Tepidisphaeraceae bacterium]|jgi:hypothetical protein|nr:hypothetical protein [Tepidisphaeraceae bacterium]
MKILLDESVPVQVRNALIGHDVSTVSGLRWKGRKNGDLLAATEHAGFEVLVIADKNLRHEQNLKGRILAIVELWTNHRPTLEKYFPVIRDGVEHAAPGAYIIRQPSLN